jgi:nitroimidazol reductase NimA-like FMN-containing flavoprotein (pyridoxamine 5'-phosphate oxidase superfamily)
MRIHEMTQDDCLAVLDQHRLGRLACAHDNQPYVVPIYFAYQSPYLYSFTTPGLKLDWMRSNPLVCVEVDQINAPDDWTTVVVSGAFDELAQPASPWDQSQRRPHPQEQPVAGATAPGQEYQRAHDLLEKGNLDWYEPGAASSIERDPACPPAPVYYRIQIERVTGRRATPGSTATPTELKN